MKPPTLLDKNGALVARVMAPDMVHLCSPYLKEAEALRLGRWLVATCGEERPMCACKGTILGLGRHGEMACFATREQEG